MPALPAAGSSAWRKKFWPACEKADLVTQEFGPQRIRLRVARAIVEPANVLLDTMAQHHYILRQKVTGAYNCRKITNGTVPSAHASGIAIDANWDTNPYTKGKLITDMPPAMVKDCQEIRTLNGVQVWRSGSDWDTRPETPHEFYDAMHWEIVATPDELKVGIMRHIASPVIALHPVLRKGSMGPAVAQLQQLLTREGYPIPASGNFLDQTNTAVRKYQKDHGLKVDGIVGAASWTSLYNNLPVIAEGEIRPNKTRVEVA